MKPGEKRRRESRAFKMGKMSYQCGNNDNFYEPGTTAHKEWQKGYEAEKAKWAEKFGGAARKVG